MKKYSTYLQVIAVILILVYAFFLRSHLYLNNDFHYFLDQARDLTLVKDIVNEGNLTLIGARSGLGGIFHGPLWLYMIAPFFVIAQGNPFWTLVPLILLISLSIVLAGFFIGKYLYDTTTGLLFAVLLAMSPPLLEANLTATNAQAMPLFFLLYLFALIKFLRGKDIYIVLVALAIGLGFHFESAFSVFLIPWTVIIFFLRKKIPQKKYLLLSLGVLLLTVSNFILFELRNRFLMTNAALGLFKGEVKPLKGYEQFTDIGFRIQDRLGLLKDSYFSPIFEVNWIVMLFISIVLLTVLSLILWKKQQKEEKGNYNKELVLLFLFPVVYYAVYILYPMPLWSHYTLPLIITSALLLALALRKILTLSSLYPKLAVGVFFILITLPTLQWIQHAYFVSPYVPMIDGSYRNQSAAVTKVYSDAQNDFGYFAYAPGILTYNVDYLMWYEGKKYKYKAENTKHPITYLIMAPVPTGDEGAHSFWKKNTVRTQGNVQQRWEMQGGIIVEKLAIPKNDPEPDANYYQNLLFR